MQKTVKESIMNVARGAILERCDYEISRIVDNILDLNTDEKKKRKLTLTIEFTPTQDRSFVNIAAVAKSTLAPATAIETSLVFTSDENGVPVLSEVHPQLPGQMAMDGTEEEDTPALLHIANAN